MKKAADAGRNFSALMKKIGKPAPPPKQEDPIDVLVMSFLMWDSTAAKAKAAYERIQQRIVDFNDLRVSMPQEIAGFIGSRYPRAEERSQRLRAVLRNIYNREHAVSLVDGLKKALKRNRLDQIIHHVKFKAFDGIFGVGCGENDLWGVF